jgi:hypothetical protein
MMEKYFKWSLYGVSWGTLVIITWHLPTTQYLVIQLCALGLFVSGAIND